MAAYICQASDVGGEGQGLPVTAYGEMAREIALLMGKKVPLAMAWLEGKINGSVCRKLKEVVSAQADYGSWHEIDSALIAVFSRSLFAEIEAVWHDFAASVSGVVVGIAVSESLQGPEELLLAARLAADRSHGLRIPITVLDAEEARRAVDQYCAATTTDRLFPVSIGRLAEGAVPAVSDAAERYRYCCEWALPPVIQHDVVARLG